MGDGAAAEEAPLVRTRWELWHGTYIIYHICGHEQQYPGPDNDLGLSDDELQRWPDDACLKCWLDDPERWDPYNR